MMRWVRELRLVPVVVLATAALFALKVLGLLVDGGYTLDAPRSAQAQPEVADGPAIPFKPGDQPPPSADGSPAPTAGSRRSWAQDVLGYPDATGSVSGGKTAEADASAKSEGAPAAKAPDIPATVAGGTPPAPLDLDHPAGSPGERAVLESLNQRRRELEARARELDVRESLLAAAEKRIEARVAELKDLEARVNAGVKKHDEAEAAGFKSLVTMYENMKAKDAAKIFDRLDLNILVDVAMQINPRRMSDILAQMSPESAERLTIEIANRSGAVGKPPPVSDLPKIEGRPSGT